MANTRSREVASLSGVGANSPGRILFEGLDLSIKTNETTVVRGSVGSGKSRLLRIVAGQDSPDQGRVNRRGGTTQVFVSTTFEDRSADTRLTIREYFLASRGLLELEAEKTRLELAMSKGDKSSKTMNRYSQVLDDYESRGGYNAEAEILETLNGLNVTGQSSRRVGLDARLNTVSSGQRTKLAIGRALFSNAELVILDDPTAHLDTTSVDWLTQRLRSDKRAVIVASNDDRMAGAGTQIVQIEDTGRSMTFRGSLGDFEKKRTAQLDAENTARMTLVRERDQLQRTYDKFKNEGDFKRSKDFARTGVQLQSRIKRLNEEIAAMPEVSATMPQSRSVKLDIKESGGRVSDSSIVIQNVKRTYNGRGGVDTSTVGEIRVKRGERLIISGDNGSGKSTLLRVIANEVSGDGDFRPERGQVVVNSRQRIGYLAPDHIGLNQNMGVLEEVLSSMEQSNEGRAVSILTAMGFDKNRLRTQKVRTLSAGEKQQLALSKLIASNPDVLILDEPTSNLRPDIKRRLADALNKFKGTVILVDHDPDFTRQISSSRNINLSAKNRR